ncbi:MAG TPA: T9SS type A sorting domain-containing protein [Chitinophagaceae bacterium]|nr:T9SS type A sorting domain-containing protein [Chitinophagaceae bacterium]
MRKFYLSALLLTIVMYTQAQKISPESLRVKKPRQHTVNNFGAGASGCDTLNFNVYDSWGTALYPFANNGGVVTGNNVYSTPEIAQYFDVSSTSDNYVSKVWIAFAYASSPRHKTATVPVNIYDGTTGTPGTLLGTNATLTISQVIDDVNGIGGPYYSEVEFSPAIQLPASKKFFVSVDVSGAIWPADTLGILSSDIDSNATGGWLKTSDGNWLDYAAAINQSLGVYIHPFASAGQGCSDLPVHLLSLSASASGKNIVLNWTVAQETGMKSYEIERAGNNMQFVQAGAVKATNSSIQHAYTFTDYNVYSTGTVYYRLKQVNNDGKTEYSNVISLTFSGSQPGIKVVNPFKGSVQVQVNSPSVQKLRGAIYDMLGRKLTATPEQTLQPGQNSISIPAGTLPKGVYILNIMIGKTTYKYKIIN